MRHNIFIEQKKNQENLHRYFFCVCSLKVNEVILPEWEGRLSCFDVKFLKKS